MTKFFHLIFVFLFLIMTVGHIIMAAEKDSEGDKTKSDVVAVTTTTTTTERSWSSILRDKDTWPLVVSGGLAALFVVGSLAGGLFYLYYANYYNNTKTKDTSNNYMNPPFYYQPPYYWRATGGGRMLHGGEERAMGQQNGPSSFTAILEMIAVAKELHEHFARPQCFTKHFCEVHEGDWSEFSDFRNKMSHAYSFLFSPRFTNILEKLPLPTVILTQIRNSLGIGRAAFMQGRNLDQDGGCSSIFPQCPSSYREIMTRFMRRITRRFNTIGARMRDQGNKGGRN